MVTPGSLRVKSPLTLEKGNKDPTCESATADF